MNKIGKAMLCTVLTGAMAVGAAGRKGVSESDHHPAEQVRQGCRPHG